MSSVWTKEVQKELYVFWELIILTMGSTTSSQQHCVTSVVLKRNKFSILGGELLSIEEGIHLLRTLKLS